MWFLRKQLQLGYDPEPSGSDQEARQLVDLPAFDEQGKTLLQLASNPHVVDSLFESFFVRGRLHKDAWSALLLSEEHLVGAEGNVRRIVELFQSKGRRAARGGSAEGGGGRRMKRRAGAGTSAGRAWKAAYDRVLVLHCVHSMCVGAGLPGLTEHLSLRRHATQTANQNLTFDDGIFRIVSNY